LKTVRRREVDAVVCTKLDRLARSLAHLVALGSEFRALGVDLVVLDQAIDTTTSAGRAMFGMLAVFAEFERDLIRERVVAGLQRAKALGKRIGRPPSTVRREQVVALRDAGLSYRGIAAAFASRLPWPTGSFATRFQKTAQGVHKPPP
jgi:DNA invertase Pin-like site-specific DNA recombinase